MENKKITRESGIELLKIIGIFLIIISHVVQTLSSDFGATLGFNDYVISVANSSTNWQVIFAMMCTYAGNLGSTLFFVCSCWFLVGKKETNTNKALNMLLDIFVVSVLWLFIMLVVYKGSIGFKNIIKSFMPTYFRNNWYMTTYLGFLFIYPFLNIMLEKIDKVTHFTIASILFIAYFVLGFIVTFPLTDDILLWIAIYFIVSYMKIYGLEICNNKKLNVIILTLSMICGSGIILATNFLGLKFAIFGGMVQYWANAGNPFNLLIIFSLFNLFKGLSITSKFVNYLSSLSMLTYIVHENMLFRIYIRPAIWQKIYLNFGYDLLFLWIIIYAIVLFIFSTLISTLYKETLQKVVIKISYKLHKSLSKLFSCIRNFAITLIK